MSRLHHARAEGHPVSIDDKGSSFAQLIQQLRTEGRSGPMLEFSRRWGELTPVIINLDYIRSALTHCLREAFVTMLRTGQRYHSRADINTLSNTVDEVMPDIIGRALYTRLYSLTRATGIGVDSFPTPPSSSNDRLAAPIARAINGIGTFRPVDVPETVVYAPTLETDPGHSGGTCANGSVIEYMHLLEEFKQLGWPLATIDKHTLAGTSWYLLPVERHDPGSEIFDVIARFPTAAGNITDTDCISRAYCIRPAVDGVVPEMVTMESAPSRSRQYGTVLRHVRLHEPQAFLGVELGAPVDAYFL